MTTMTVTVQDAQQRLLELLSAVSNGSTIIIEKDKKPFARLVGMRAAHKNKKRTAGLNRGEIQITDDFDAPLPDGFWLSGR